MLDADPFADQVGVELQLAPGGHLRLPVANASSFSEIFSMFPRT